MSEEIHCQDLTHYLSEELFYTEAILGKNWLLSKEIFKEFKDREPIHNPQIVEKGGCNN